MKRNHKLFFMFILIIITFIIIKYSNSSNTCPNKPELISSSKINLWLNGEPVSYSKLTGPHIIKKDSNYNIWFKCRFDGFSNGICYAESIDKINWYLDLNNSIFSYYTDGTPSVLYINGKLNIWFREDSVEQEIISLVSENNFYTSGVLDTITNSWDSISISGPNVLKVDDRYLMYYRGSPFRNQMNSDIGLAVSHNAITWRRFQEEPIFARSEDSWDSSLISDPHIILIDNNYYMFYSGHNNKKLDSASSKDEVGIGKKIGLAVSKDGISWDRCYDEPLIDKNLKSDNAFALYENNILNLWYRTTNEIDGSGGDIIYEEYNLNP